MRNTKVSYDDFIWWGLIILTTGGFIGACLPH